MRGALKCIGFCGIGRETWKQAGCGCTGGPENGLGERITINVPVVFMARYVMILRGATSL